MKIKRTVFENYFKISGYRKIYPKSATDIAPHLTIERNDFTTYHELGDVEFTKFHYTETTGNGTTRVAFNEVNGTWTCEADTLRVPRHVDQAASRGKAMAKPMITALNGKCRW